jgi:hypothetical protein
LWSNGRRGLAGPLLALGLLVAVVATHRDEAAGAEAFQVLITTSELVTGENRFAFGLLKNDTLLEGARVIVRIYDLSPEPPRLYAETPAPYHKLEVVEQNQRVHIHPDGTRHVHDSATDVLGVYVAQVRFPRPGPWGIEVLARQGDGTVEAARFTVEALAAGHAPMPGTPAPRSRNPVVTDVADLRTLDSSDPPDPRLHQHRIADAIIQGKPQVIVFATPKYCTSRVCGPVVDVVRTLIPAYGDRVVFIHQEIWQAGTQTFAPTVEEWKLRSEPWIFVVDGGGTVRARFEGLTTRREIEAALRRVLGP